MHELQPKLNLQTYINSSLKEQFPDNSSSVSFPYNPMLGIEEEFDYPYYGEALLKYRNAYNSVHGYLSFACCIFGITANILNIIVLTRKNMISPTNAILIGLAVSDIFVMSSYIPFTYHNYIRNHATQEDQFSYGWAIFTLFHQHFTLVSHTISTWLTVTVAIWRFLAVRFPQNSTVWCSMYRAKCAILATYLVCPIMGIPGYLSSTIVPVASRDGVMYFVHFSRISQLHNKLLQNMFFWISSVTMKLVPCVALTGISFGLIKVLYERNLRRQRLRADADRNHDRTTRMLLAVLMLFLLTEFPSGLLALLTGILGTDFFNHVYSNFGETMDVLALINNAINFIIYCTMSQQFRNTFANLFLPSFFKSPTIVSASTV
ncbi:G-protein coupled receptor dmsr-1-like [Argiope bruennichi]|uniref:Sex peptide receptor like protein n=1 Tax=Argiope bruennichi TaxID=94029 RepID=A0A8T0F1W7_ARGBR|nr:G-protein coupled receptor dmsr-1-like [Argiope bruennichi]KAF8782908.1 Sex peptide receptor like protein [Argiope bruennichi]